MTEALRDPTNEIRPVGLERPTRPAELAGLTVGLLDISKARGDVFLDQLEQQLHRQGLKTERYQKPTFAKPAPVDLRQEIAEKCDLVIEALAD